MKRVKEILSNKKNWISVFTLIVAFVAVIINFFTDEYSGKIVSVVLSLVALEFFILTVGVFEDIIKKLDKIGDYKDKNVWVSAENAILKVKQLFYDAKHEIIVIGGTLSDLNAYRAQIDDISNNINIRLLALNIENKDILNEYNKLIDRRGRVSNLQHLKYFENNENIEIQTFESLPLAYFIARDMDYPYGSIIVTHLFSVGSSHPCLELTPSNGEWYDLYHNQIKKLLTKGIPWKSVT